MPGLLRGIVRTAAVAGTATAVSGRVRRRQMGRWAREDAQQADYYAAPSPPPQPAYAAPAAPPAAPAAAPAADDELAQLERLADLKERGVLSDAEFAQQKQRILAG